MFDKVIALLERFVAAVELIAADGGGTVANNAPAKDEPKKAPAKRTPAKKEEPEDDEEPEEKAPAKKAPAKRAPAKKKSGADTDELFDEIKQMAAAIGKGESDDAANDYDDLLEEYGIKTVGRLADEDVPAFHEAISDIVARYYE